MNKPQEWQVNPENIDTAKVQYWSYGGIMITAQMTQADARQLVREGKAYIITGQAIGQMEQFAVKD